jgi:hypothetical protein
MADVSWKIHIWHYDGVIVGGKHQQRLKIGKVK